MNLELHEIRSQVESILLTHSVQTKSNTPYEEEVPFYLIPYRSKPWAVVSCAHPDYSTSEVFYHPKRCQIPVRLDWLRDPVSLEGTKYLRESADRIAQQLMKSIRGGEIHESV